MKLLDEKAPHGQFMCLHGKKSFRYSPSAGFSPKESQAYMKNSVPRPLTALGKKWTPIHGLSTLEGTPAVLPEIASQDGVEHRIFRGQSVSD